MIVIDASAVIEILLGTNKGLGVYSEMVLTDSDFLSPEILDLEVLQVLRRFTYSKSISESVASQAARNLPDLKIARHRHHDLLDRVWSLRHNYTAYDAAYLSLSEACDAPLWTCDAKFARSPENSVPIRLF